MKNLVAAALTSLALASCGDSNATGPSGRLGTSRLSFSRPAGQFSGAESGSFTLANALFETYVRDGGNAVEVRVRSMDNRFCSLQLGAPAGRQLTVGTYPNAARYPFQGPSQAGLDFSCLSGCNRLQGSFTITTLAYRSSGELERLVGTFAQSCLRWDGVREAPMEELTGEVLIAPSTP